MERVSVVIVNWNAGGRDRPRARASAYPQSPDLNPAARGLAARDLTARPRFGRSQLLTGRSPNRVSQREPPTLGLTDARPVALPAQPEEIGWLDTPLVGGVGAS
jgi:hypothetical protein